MKILIPRAFSHFREHKPSCEIRLICSCCRCAHSGSVSFPPPNRQSLKSVQSLNCIETLNFHEGNDILYHLQGQLASGFKPRSREGNDVSGPSSGTEKCSFNPRSHEGNDEWVETDIPQKDSVSIHVPTRGTTRKTSTRSHRRPCFNPRSHEGNDILFSVVRHRCAVSIHVPTRGTTRENYIL